MAHVSDRAHVTELVPPFLLAKSCSAVMMTSNEFLNLTAVPVLS